MESETRPGLNGEQIDTAANAAIEAFDREFIQPLVSNFIVPNQGEVTDPGAAFELAAVACEKLAVKLRQRAAELRARWS